MTQISMPYAESDVPPHVPEKLVWAYDFSGDPLFASEPMTAAQTLTEGAPDIFFSPLHGGFWVLTRFEDIRTASRLPDIFSNYPAAIPATVGRTRKMAPIEIDPPELDRYRNTLGPALAPPKVRAMEDNIRATAIALIGDIAGSGRIEFVESFSSKLPIRIFLMLVDVAESEAEKLRVLHHDLFWAPDVEARIDAGRTLEAYYTDLVSARWDNPGDDLVGRYIKARPAEGAFSLEDVVDATMQLFVAGLDTVTNSLSLTWRYLAEEPDLQAMIRSNPAIIPDVVDEMLRYTGIISSTRTLTRDHVFCGVEMKAGDRVLMPLSLANRDRDVFPDGRTVKVDRPINNHLTFGSGPHRCVGSHLARLEMIVAVQEWFARLPPFSLDPDDPPVSHGGHAIGMNRLSLILGAAA